MLSRRRHLSMALILLAVLLVYANSLGNSFHFDDFHTVTDNPAIRSLGNLPRFFTDATAFSVLPANQTYRPVVSASLALDYALAHGYNPFWFHLSSLLWFLVLVALLFFWAEDLFQKTSPNPHNWWLALGLSAWFGVHPAMAETVNYVIQRGDLYCTLGCVAAMVIYARFPQLRRWGVYLLPFALALLSKPPAAVFPALLLVYVFLFESDDIRLGKRWLRSLRAAAPAIAVTAVLMALQAHMTPKSYAPTILSAAAYRLTQPYVWMRYAAALLLPLHLNVDTDLQPFSSLTGQAVEGLLFLGGLLALIVASANRKDLRPVTYGLLWFILTQLPTSLYALSEVENDHRMFFSFPGLMLAAVWALALAYHGLQRWLGERHSPQRQILPYMSGLLCALLLGGYAYGAHRRNAVWHDEASLWADDVAKSPHNGRGLMIYGLTRLNAGDLRGALGFFEQAQQYTPNYPTLEINLGVVQGLLAAQGSPGAAQLAEQHFQRAAALAPADDLPHAYYGRWLLGQGRLTQATTQLSAAVQLNSQRLMQRDLLMQAELEQGQLAEAATLARGTLALAPEDAEAHAVLNGGSEMSPARSVDVLINSSLAAYQAGDFPASIHAAEAALRLNPNSAKAWNNLGAGYGALHQWDLGIPAEEHALAIEPNLAIAANNLRWFRSQTAAGGNRPKVDETAKSAADYINLSLTLSQAGQYERSVKAAQQALAIDPHSAEAWNNVAAGDEALHRWSEAVAAAQHAVALRPDFQLAKNNLAWSLAQQRAALR